VTPSLTEITFSLQCQEPRMVAMAPSVLLDRATMLLWLAHGPAWSWPCSPSKPGISRRIRQARARWPVIPALYQRFPETCLTGVRYRQSPPWGPMV